MYNTRLTPAKSCTTFEQLLLEFLGRKRVVKPCIVVGQAAACSMSEMTSGWGVQDRPDGLLVLGRDQAQRVFQRRCVESTPSTEWPGWHAYRIRPGTWRRSIAEESARGPTSGSDNGSPAWRIAASWPSSRVPVVQRRHALTTRTIAASTPSAMPCPLENLLEASVTRGSSPREFLPAARGRMPRADCPPRPAAGRAGR